MEINLSPEMIKVVRRILRDTPMQRLYDTSYGEAGYDGPGYRVTGADALELFEELYLENQLAEQK